MAFELCQYVGRQRQSQGPGYGYILEDQKVANVYIHVFVGTALSSTLVLSDRVTPSTVPTVSN